MFRRLFVAVLAMAAAGVVATADAQQGSENWVLLGTKSVDLKAGNDTVDVSKARGDYRAIRVRNTGDAIVITKTRVGYSDNSFHVEDRSINLLSGERSRPIDQRNNGKFVDTIAITYSGSANGGTANIQIWGLQDNPRAARAGGKPADPVQPVKTAPIAAGPVPAAPGSPTALAGGDVLFGTQQVGFGVDRDVVRVGAEIGKFDKIRLRVLDNDIFLNELKVIYSNGEPDTLAVNAEIKQNQRTNWLTLKGDRFIKEIQLSYRSRPNFKGQAHVEVFGQYAEGWLAPTGEGRKYNQGWVLLGAQTADYFKITSGKAGFDRDIISVGRQRGRLQEDPRTGPRACDHLERAARGLRERPGGHHPDQDQGRGRLVLWSDRPQGRHAGDQGDRGVLPFAHHRHQSDRSRQGRGRGLGSALSVRGRGGASRFTSSRQNYQQGHLRWSCFCVCMACVLASAAVCPHLVSRPASRPRGSSA